MKAAIKLEDSVIKHIEEMRKGKKARFTIYGFNDDGSMIVLKKISEDGEGLNEFVDSLPDDDVVYGVYYYGFSVGDGTRRSRLCFITWIPKTADKSRKFMAAISKSSLKNQFGDVIVDFAFSTKSEITESEINSKCILSIH